jgi:hypothetical protein
MAFLQRGLQQLGVLIIVTWRDVLVVGGAAVLPADGFKFVEVVVCNVHNKYYYWVGLFYWGSHILLFYVLTYDKIIKWWMQPKDFVSMVFLRQSDS